MTSEVDGKKAKDPGFGANLRTLFSTFPRDVRFRLVLYVVSQVFISLMGIVGISVVLPIMQVMMGANMDTGYLGLMSSILGHPSRGRFVVLTSIIMVVAFFVKSLATIALTWWSLGFVSRLQVRTSTRLLRHYLDESYLDHRTRDLGDMMRRIDSAVMDAHQKVLGSILALISSLMSVVLLLGMLLVIMPGPTVAAVIYFSLIILVVQKILAKISRDVGRTNQRTGWLKTRTLMEALQGFREIYMHDAQDEFISRYRKHSDENIESGRKENTLASLPTQIFQTMTILGVALLLCWIVWTGSAHSAIPTLTLFMAVIIQLLPTMSALSAQIGAIRVGQAGLALTAETLRTESVRDAVSDAGELEASNHTGATGLGRADTGTIDIRNLKFRYPDGNHDVLSGIDISVSRGSSLALCGLSGSGKTTLVDIVLGLLPPTSGHVRVGGMDVAQAGSAWRHQVAYVPQDVYIVDDTISANIAFGEPPDEWDISRIRRCVERAKLDDVVREAPQGLDTRLGEHGSLISGGQRQRIGIARALYRNPAVLVLDEATSALDNQTERQITSTIESLNGDITTILVAHRLSSVRNVDSLVFLENGRISGRGTFDEVRDSCPGFARLVALGRLDDTKETV
ncbi:ABC transporter ATP-binding protein [Acidipropionibacterium jensenii]|nr:ABC transporter ATP-binding protein [Acidipropionibacterium jensenii]